jgi:hypothetical protein
MFRIVAGSGAVLVIGAATFWVASRGPAAHPAAAPDPPAITQPAPRVPRETVTEAPAKTADPVLGATKAIADAPANAPPPPSAAPAARPAPQTPVVHAPLPASPVLARPKHSPHREYDPQGI